MWYDNWSDMGPLIQYLTHRDIYDARIPMNVKVGDMIHNGKLKWPQDWYDKFPLITSMDDPNFQNEANDTVVWMSKNGEKVKFSVKTATCDLCTEYPKRMSNQDKMTRWGLHIVNRCPLCHNDNEDIQHLFFKCIYSSEVWSKAKEMADIKCDESNWHELIGRLAGVFGYGYTTVNELHSIGFYQLDLYNSLSKSLGMSKYGSVYSEPTYLHRTKYGTCRRLDMQITHDNVDKDPLIYAFYGYKVNICSFKMAQEVGLSSYSIERNKNRWS
ncbi:reverse transcriptase zinc-binding domain-containing protein [Artemisia annua]|uniref:Reverse transcriptase zinc-binding domain-containing protein n=1 Tax=Artemisia annua TaxID=35608 RepID=A0A2U1NU05_ARTAN|nr:reverse transcriptase zinc-binding domain-containing protein [Artemisia annua]